MMSSRRLGRDPAYNRGVQTRYPSLFPVLRCRRRRGVEGRRDRPAIVLDARQERDRTLRPVEQPLAMLQEPGPPLITGQGRAQVGPAPLQLIDDPLQLLQRR